jgi:hypothetical protein
MSVEGVWIAAGKTASGWAKWQAVDSADVAHYWYWLPHGDSYAVHVGCGGTLPQWATAPDSRVVSGTFNDFVCFDVKGQSGYGLCLHIN